MVSLHEEDDNHVIEDKRNDKADTCWNQKMHMPPMSLLLQHEMVAMHCFVGFLPSLHYRHADQTNFDNFKKNSICGCL